MERKNLKNKTKNELIELLLSIEEKYADSNAYAAELVSEIHEKNTKLNEAQNELLKSERLRVLNSMIVTYNHEFRNPLAIAMGSLELYTKDKNIKRFEILQISLQRIESLVEKIDELAKNDVSFVNYTDHVEMIDLGKR